LRKKKTVTTAWTIAAETIRGARKEEWRKMEKTMYRTSQETKKKKKSSAQGASYVAQLKAMVVLPHCLALGCVGAVCPVSASLICAGFHTQQLSAPLLPPAYRTNCSTCLDEGAASKLNNWSDAGRRDCSARLVRSVEYFLSRKLKDCTQRTPLLSP
jgi:hypothetical protein